MATPVRKQSRTNRSGGSAGGGSVVAVHARRWIPTSGIEWKKGVIVTAHHGIKRDEEIKVRRRMEKW
jgi:hypothetical protein